MCLLEPSAVYLNHLESTALLYCVSCSTLLCANVFNDLVTRERERKTNKWRCCCCWYCYYCTILNDVLCKINWFSDLCLISLYKAFQHTIIDHWIHLKPKILLTSELVTHIPKIFNVPPFLIKQHVYKISGQSIKLVSLQVFQKLIIDWINWANL